MRASVHAAKASTIVTSACVTPTARSETTRTTKTVRCPATSRRWRPAPADELDHLAEAHRRTRIPPDRGLVEEAPSRSDAYARRGRRPGVQSARSRGRSRTPQRSPQDDEADEAPRSPTCGFGRLRRDARGEARSGSRESPTSFQTLMTTATGRPLKPRARNIATVVAMPTAAPWAIAESAVDASVTRDAWK